MQTADHTPWWSKCTLFIANPLQKRINQKECHDNNLRKITWAQNIDDSKHSESKL